MQSILTTESVPPRRRADYWEEMVSTQFVPAHCVPNARSAFRARIRSLDLDRVKLCEVRSHGTDVLRTARHVSRSDGHFFLLSLQVAGIGRLEHAGRTVTLNPGDMVLYDTSRSYQLSFAAEQQQLVLRIPRDELMMRCPGVESMVGIGIPSAIPAANLAGDLARNVAALECLPSARSQWSISATLMDLVVDSLLALDLGTPVRTASVGLGDAQRVARNQLADPGFSVARWAGSLGISERYLRQLFQSSSRSPAQYLWAQRLERAASALREPGCRQQSITDIALGCGFSDSAHFSHSFRQAFGMSPRQYRLANRPADF